MFAGIVGSTRLTAGTPLPTLHTTWWTMSAGSRGIVQSTDSGRLIAVCGAEEMFREPTACRNSRSSWWHDRQFVRLAQVSHVKSRLPRFEEGI
jgi:hypothetical protein